jgi:dUTP pyrophosphatase
MGEAMIEVKLLRPFAKLPTRSHRSAGFDLYACEEKDCLPGQVTSIPIGIATALPTGFAALVWDRSGMGKRGLTVFGGVIDEDYRGEWFVLLFNSTDTVHEVHVGDRVAQFLLQRVEQAPVTLVEELSATERGDGRWMSTGR